MDEWLEKIQGIFGKLWVKFVQNFCKFKEILSKTCREFLPKFSEKRNLLFKKNFK